jgi:hypothetical protein
LIDFGKTDIGGLRQVDSVKQSSKCRLLHVWQHRNKNTISAARPRWQTSMHGFVLKRSEH